MSEAATAQAPDFSQLGPLQLGNFLEGAKQELRDLQGKLERAHSEAEDAEIVWVAHFDQVMAALDKETEGKLPGEDKCVGIARRRGGTEQWERWRRAERRAKSLERIAALVNDQISACQSEAKLMRNAG